MLELPPVAGVELLFLSVEDEEAGLLLAGLDDVAPVPEDPVDFDCVGIRVEVMVLNDMTNSGRGLHVTGLEARLCKDVNRPGFPHLTLYNEDRPNRRTGHRGWARSATDRPQPDAGSAAYGLRVSVARKVGR